MTDALIPLTHLALDWHPPAGVSAERYLLDRGERVIADDLGRTAVDRGTARRLLAEQKAAEQRRRELAAQQDAQLEEQWRAQFRPGVPVSQDGTTGAALMLAAAKDAAPKRRTPLEDALGGGGMTYRPLATTPEE